MSRVIRVRYVGKHSLEYEGVRRALAASQIVNVADSDRQAIRVLSRIKAIMRNARKGAPAPEFASAKKRRADDLAAGALAKLPRAHFNG